MEAPVMPAHQVQRKVAQRFARYAQGGTVVLAAIAVGSAVFALPGMGAPVLEPVPVPPVQVALSTDAAEDDGFPVDHDAIVDRLLDMHNAPQPLVEPEEVASVPDADPDKPAGSGLENISRAMQVRYLGSMTPSSGESWAFIAVDGKQRWVRSGEKIGKKMLISVDPDQIVLEDDNGQKKIPLQTRIGRSVTNVTTAARPRTPPAASARDRAIDQARGRTVQDAELERHRDIQPRRSPRND